VVSTRRSALAGAATATQKAASQETRETVGLVGGCTGPY